MRSEISVIFGFAAVMVALCIFFVAIPVHAKDMQADQQCPPGGTVGQKCQDTTNGYVTQGHCTHIHVCKADSWNTNAPKGCGSSGNIYAPTGDCPKGPQIGQGTPRPVAPTPTTTDFSTSPNGSSISGDIFDRAFSDDADTAVVRSDTVSTTTIDGIEYFISGGEALVAGEPLTEEVPDPTPPPRSTLALGSVSGLSPTQVSQGTPVGTSYSQTYNPAVGAFSSAGSRQYVQQADFASRLVSLGTDAVQGFSDGLVRLLISASGLNYDTSSEVVTLRPYESMYDQAGHADLAPFIEPPWQKVVQQPLAYMFKERLSNVGELLRGALKDTGAAGYDLFTADLTKSKNEFGSAIQKTIDAFGLMGNLAASVALKVVMRN